MVVQKTESFEIRLGVLPTRKKGEDISVLAEPGGKGSGVC